MSGPRGANSSLEARGGDDDGDGGWMLGKRQEARGEGLVRGGERGAGGRWASKGSRGGKGMMC